MITWGNFYDMSTILPATNEHIMVNDVDRQIETHIHAQTNRETHSSRAVTAFVTTTKLSYVEPGYYWDR